MVPGRTNVSLTLSWSTDYDPIAAAQQPGAAKQGPKGDADSEVMLLVPRKASPPATTVTLTVVLIMMAVMVIPTMAYKLHLYLQVCQLWPAFAGSNTVLPTLSQRMSALLYTAVIPGCPTDGFQFCCAQQCLLL